MGNSMFCLISGEARKERAVIRLRDAEIFSSLCLWVTVFSACAAFYFLVDGTACPAESVYVSSDKCVFTANNTLTDSGRRPGYNLGVMCSLIMAAAWGAAGMVSARHLADYDEAKKDAEYKAKYDAELAERTRLARSKCSCGRKLPTKAEPAESV